jgi:hypothetical protein
MHEVTFGDPAKDGITIPVYAQRVSYIINRAIPAIYDVLTAAQVTNLSGDVSEILTQVGHSGAYDILVALAPSVGKRMTRAQFCGFVSDEAMAAGDYDESLAMDATIDEMVAAFKTVFQVNGMDSLVSAGKLLGKAIDPSLIKAEIGLTVANYIGSQRSQQPSGGSDLTSSTASPPTSEASEESPSDALTA